MKTPLEHNIAAHDYIDQKFLYNSNCSNHKAYILTSMKNQVMNATHKHSFISIEILT